jgi:hypothetical protein
VSQSQKSDRALGGVVEEVATGELEDQWHHRQACASGDLSIVHFRRNGSG